MPTEQLRIDREERSTYRARRETLRRTQLHALVRRDLQVRLHGCLSEHDCLLRRGAARARLRGRALTRSARWSRETGGGSHCLGSAHCDSNRNGGKYDGTMGVVCALEVCRLNDELGLGLPLQLISFLEEEGSASGRCCSKPHRRAAGHGGGTVRDVPGGRRRAQLLGARRTGGFEPPAGGMPRTSWTD